MPIFAFSNFLAKNKSDPLACRGIFWLKNKLSGVLMDFQKDFIPANT
jgi:hypothetical protein